jgi:hypothetical protein
MAETLAGFPFWILNFDEDGQPRSPSDTDRFVEEVAAQNLSDLFIFSHGWNNDPATAMWLYQGFFGEVRKVLDDASLPRRRDATVGVAGVIWPSILWPDNELPESAGGAASLDAPAPEADLTGELKKVFLSPDEHRIVEDLTDMLDRKERSEEALLAFKAKLNELMRQPAAGQPAYDNLEQRGIAVSDQEWFDALDALADQEASSDDAGGAAGLGDTFKRLWGGAKAALRVTTYWTMKNRAGVVGKNGLGPLIGRLHEAAPNLKVHLLGHSFGARLVSCALSGLPDLPAGDASPVKSLFLLQGAFSHFTFADALPFDTSRKGELAGLASRVDGPLLTTHSLKDLAVGTAYPLASIVAGQDAADASDILFRWGAMGHDGAQSVDAAQDNLSAPGTAYAFAAGKWLNLDSNMVIINGGPPSGAHSDIIHPQTAWAALAAAGISGA